MDEFNITKLLNPENTKKISTLEPVKLEEERLTNDPEVSTVDENATAKHSEDDKESIRKTLRTKKRDRKHRRDRKTEDVKTVITERTKDTQATKESGTKASKASRDSGEDSGDSKSYDSDASDLSKFSDMSDNIRKQKKEEKYRQLHDMRRELYNKIGRFKSLGYKVKEFKGDEPIDELLMIFDNLKYEQRYLANIRFFRLIIGFIGWLIENVCIRIGVSSLKGFSTQVRSFAHEFDEFYDDLTEPVYIKQESGEYIKHEKHNIINYVNSRPEIGLMTRFATMAVSYSAANNIETLADLMAD